MNLLFLAFQTNSWLDGMMPTFVNYGVKILGAIVALIIGRWLIKYVVKLIGKAMEKQSIEPTLIRYIGSTVAILLNIGLVLAILGFFGFETATFAALLAGAGLAIGTAWGGLLKNFAAGAFIVVLRPFKVGDFI
jgi:small conductance mechanosensitive channel